MASKSRFPIAFTFQPIFDFPCNEDLMKELEAARGHSLPDDFVAFLRESNGAFFPGETLKFPLADATDVNVAWNESDAWDQNDLGFLDRVYGLGEEKSIHDLRYSGNAYDFQLRVPGYLMAIGDDNSWNRVCLSLAEETYGNVFVWQPGEPWEPDGKNVPTLDYVRPVAKNFTEFWGLLREASDDDFL
jgi:hypothetical protein